MVNQRYKEVTAATKKTVADVMGVTNGLDPVGELPTVVVELVSSPMG